MIIVGASTGWVAYRLRFENIILIALAAAFGYLGGGAIAGLSLFWIVFQPHQYAPGLVNYEPRISGFFAIPLLYILSLVFGIGLGALPFVTRHRWKLRKRSQQSHTE